MKLTTTPWGHPQQQTQIGEGIVVVSTAGHGGIWLSPIRWADFSALFPTFKPFAGPPWLEEDCDVCLAALAFPSAFSTQAVANAVEMVINYGGSNGDYFKEAKAWLATPAAERVRSIHAQATAENANKWERGSMGTSGQGWSVCLTNTTTKETKREQFTDYPTQQFYTEAELEALREEVTA